MRKLRDTGGQNDDRPDAEQRARRAAAVCGGIGVTRVSRLRLRWWKYRRNWRTSDLAHWLALLLPIAALAVTAWMVGKHG